NGTRARLKDIDALLASTGLRQDGYAVTAQNDIDFVIQAVPALRRELIEEAAGVRRLRDQRQEALNRLAEADRDMRRARDILNELSPRAEELRVQAVAELRASERAGSRVVDELARAVEAARIELGAADAALQTAADGERTAREAQAGVEAERAAAQQRRQELQRERVAIDAELRQLEGRLQFLGEQQQQLRTQLEAWSLRQSTLTDELERRRGHVETADRELRDVDARASI